MLAILFHWADQPILIRCLLEDKPNSAFLQANFSADTGFLADSMV
jgi:hypothetical protein